MDVAWTSCSIPLTGRFIAQSLKCLAPFGRFVELGKSDIYRNNKLSLERLGENISYFVVDVDRLAAQKPELHQQSDDAKWSRCSNAANLQPHEITEFPISKLPEAMRFMTRAAYRGKIVMNMQDDRVQTLPPRNATFRPDRSYLISGGASGFGLEIARWMVDRGARHLVLLSRSGCKTDEDRATVDAMKERGVEVLMAQADITDADAVRRLIAANRDRVGCRLAGVIHGAAVLDDASIPTMDMDRFRTRVQPESARGLESARGDLGDRSRPGFLPDALLDLVRAGFVRSGELRRGQLLPRLAGPLPPATRAARDVVSTLASWDNMRACPILKTMSKTSLACWKLRACS